MSRFFAQGVALLVLVTLIANSNGQWYDCGTTLSQRLVRFNTFTAYPSPAIPGQQVHLRATYQAYAQLDDTATVELNVLYGGVEQVLAVTGIPLCNLTSSVSCPVVATPNYTQAISFDWLVPSIADGNYLVNFKIRSPGKASAFGCIAFNASVSNPSSTQNGVFVSSYQARLEGDAQFTTSPFLSRDVGTSIQVGPFGPLGSGISWGTFDAISGTGDVVHPSFDPSNYIWAMSGTLVNKSTDLVQSSHVYQGQFWVGYSGPYGNYNTQNNMLTNGTFVLTHSQVSSSNYTFNGIFVFLPSGGAFPTGWFNPINLARLGPSTLNTNQYGQLIASASTGTCLASPTLATCTGTNNQVTQGPSRDDDPRHLKIILPIVLGVFFVLILPALIVLGVLYCRKQRRVSEDRVYNPRPAEYGSALVVDDIMQKSRNHTGAELPILDPSSRQAFPPVYLEEYPAPVLTKPRTVRRTPQEPRDRRQRASTRQDRRPAPRRPAYSDTDSEPQLRGRAANRSRSPPRGRDVSRSRSISRSRSLSRSRSRSRSRSVSPSDRRSRSRSISRSMSRSRSPASGSSMSRSSFSEGPRR